MVGTAASTDPSFMVVIGIVVEWTCPSMEVHVELLSPRGAQLAILELKIREHDLSAYLEEVVGEAKKMCRITGFSS